MPAPIVLPERRITKPKSELKRRKWDLKSSAFNQDRPSNNSKIVDLLCRMFRISNDEAKKTELKHEHQMKFNNFFKKRYGVSYTDLVERMKPSLKNIGSYLKEHSHEDCVVLFPMRGSVFNYYVARGILNQIRLENAKLGKQTRIRLYTINVAADSNNPNTMSEYVTLQLAKIFGNRMPARVAMFDIVDVGRVTNVMKQGLQNLRVPEETFDIVRVSGDQNISKYSRTFLMPQTLFAKTGSGKVYPRTHISNLPDELANERSYHHEYKSIKNVSDDGPLLYERIGDIREMLFYLGRAYYRLEFV